MRGLLLRHWAGFYSTCGGSLDLSRHLLVTLSQDYTTQATTNRSPSLGMGCLGRQGLHNPCGFRPMSAPRQGFRSTLLRVDGVPVSRPPGFFACAVGVPLSKVPASSCPVPSSAPTPQTDGSPLLAMNWAGTCSISIEFIVWFTLNGSAPDDHILPCIMWTF